MLTETADTDAVIQVCVSPSARYVAVLMAPDAVDNPYDTYQLPLPERPETRILQVADGEPVVALNGSSISWCRSPALTPLSDRPSGDRRPRHPLWAEPPLTAFTCAGCTAMCPSAFIQRT